MYVCIGLTPPPTELLMRLVSCRLAVSKDHQVTRARIRQQNKPHTNTARATAQRRSVSQCDSKSTSNSRESG